MTTKQQDWSKRFEKKFFWLEDIGDISGTYDDLKRFISSEIKKSYQEGALRQAEMDADTIQDERKKAYLEGYKKGKHKGIYGV